MKNVFRFCALSLLCSSLNAQANPPVLVDSPVKKVFVARGFDDNDHVEVVVQGEFPSSCYRIAKSAAKVDVENKTITIRAKSYLYKEAVCAQITLPFIQSVSLGIVPSGSNEVILEGKPNMKNQKLLIDHTDSANPDDFLYAPVEHAGFTQVGEQRRQTIHIEGRFPNMFVGCMRMKDVKTRMTPGNVIVVQPIAEIRQDDSCGSDNSFNLKVQPPERLKSGDYLIHVRGLSESSMNRFVSISDD